MSETGNMQGISRRQFVKFSVAALAAGTAMSALTGCDEGTTGGTGDGAATTVTGGKILRVGTTDQGGTFQPWVGTPTSANYLVFETIVMRQGDGSLEPWLLDSLEWTDDTTLIAKIKEEAAFDGGEPVLGEDVMYTFEQMVADPFSPMASHFGNFDFEKSTVSEDGRTVTLKLKQPYGPIGAYLDLPYVVDKSVCESWAADDERWWDAPPTSAPYGIAENVSGSHVSLKRREDYWNKDFTPDWEEVTVRFYSDRTAMFVAFENHEIDMALDVAANDYKRLEAGDVADADTAKSQLINANAAFLFCMNPNKTEFTDPKVREAIAHAINRDSIGEVAYGGLYEITDSVIAKETKYYKSCGTYDKGIEYAKQCLAESAYPDGFEFHVVGMQSDSAMWEVVQDNLSQLNISVNLETFDMGTCIPIWMQPDGTDVMVISVAGGNVLRDPYADLSAIWKNGPYPVCQILDEEYNEWFEKSVYTNDDAQREEAYAWLQQWLYDNCQALPLVSASYAMAYRSDVISSVDFFSATRANLMYCKAV